ncbi:MAG: OprO/OprP family phosphate-selective porin [Acetobacteraceae bacterium]|nr:OprO/OprP family phosphate-selective porin [Acetobacteraceae bacterium]
MVRPLLLAAAAVPLLALDLAAQPWSGVRPGVEPPDRSAVESVSQPDIRIDPPPTRGASPERPTTAPMFAMRGGRPTLTLLDGNLTIQPVARFDFDMGGYRDQPLSYNGRPPKFLDDTRAGVPAAGLNVRRARVGLQGTFLRDFTYNFTWEFGQAPGSQFQPVEFSRLFELQAAYVGIPWVTPRIGAYTLMHSIQYSMSSFERTFLEPASIVNVATSLASGDSRLAIGGEARGDRWFAALYVSDGSTTVLNDGRQRGIVGRATGLAVNERWAKLSIGLNASVQFAPGTSGAPNVIRLRDYPEIRLDPTRLLDTGNIPAGQGWALGPEIQALLGPVYIQSEWYAVRLDTTNGTGNRNFWGYYVDASLPLFGEPRRYDRLRGVFTRPRFEEVNPQAGQWGWLEFAARWSWLTLNDYPTRGGSQGILGFALNWYPSPRLRATLQYQVGDIRLQPGTSNSTTGANRAFQSLGARVAFNW